MTSTTAQSSTRRGSGFALALPALLLMVIFFILPVAALLLRSVTEPEPGLQNYRELFAKHGMTNLIYWNRAEGQPQADRMLVYLLGHDSVDAAKASFDSFRQDPDWVTARKASEEKAGGSLTEAKDGVLSEFLVPTDYSTWK